MEEYQDKLTKLFDDLDKSRIVLKKEDGFRIIHELNKRAVFDDEYKEECVDYVKMVTLFNVIEKLSNSKATSKDMQIGERCCDKMRFYCMVANDLLPVFEGKEFTVSVLTGCIDTMGINAKDPEDFSKLACEIIEQYAYTPTEEERKKYFWINKIL